MKKLTVDDIDMDVDTADLSLFESALMHEIKTYGEKEFISEYSKKINSGQYKDDKRKANLIIAIINVICNYSKVEPPEFKVEKLDKFVLDSYSFYMLVISKNKKKIIKKANKKALSFFKDRGFLYEDLEGCVKWHI